MTNQSFQPNWSEYYKAQAGRTARPFFVDALTRFNADTDLSTPNQAIDLGCGDGTETLALLAQGWRVLAIDQEPEAIANVLSKVPLALQARLETRVCTFEELTLPAADFIYAGYSLPFCAPTHFPDLWAKIVGALQPGGRFAGQFFGVHDEWATNPQMTFHTAAAVRALGAQPLTIEFFHETEEDGRTLRGPKHWHFFDVIVQKRVP